MMVTVALLSGKMHDVTVPKESVSIFDFMALLENQYDYEMTCTRLSFRGRILSPFSRTLTLLDFGVHNGAVIDLTIVEDSPPPLMDSSSGDGGDNGGAMPEVDPDSSDNDTTIANDWTELMRQFLLAAEHIAARMGIIGGGKGKGKASWAHWRRHHWRRWHRNGQQRRRWHRNGQGPRHAQWRRQGQAAIQP